MKMTFHWLFCLYIYLLTSINIIGLFMYLFVSLFCLFTDLFLSEKMDEFYSQTNKGESRYAEV